MSHLGKKITWRFDRLALEYDEWYRTPLGSLSDALEKNAIFSLAQWTSCLDENCRLRVQNCKIIHTTALQLQMKAKPAYFVRKVNSSEFYSHEQRNLIWQIKHIDSLWQLCLFLLSD